MPKWFPCLLATVAAQAWPQVGHAWEQEPAFATGFSVLAQTPYHIAGMSYARRIKWGFDWRVGLYFVGDNLSPVSWLRDGKPFSPKGGYLDLDLLWSPRKSSPWAYPYLGIGARALRSTLTSTNPETHVSANAVGGLSILKVLFIESRYGLLKTSVDPSKEWELRFGLSIPLGADEP